MSQSVNRRSAAPHAMLLADLSLLFVAVIWGASYAVAKDTLSVVPVSGLIFFRFLIAVALLVTAYLSELRQIRRQDALRGVGLGVILSAIFLAETVGVFHTSATNAAFLISLCTLFTPILEAAVHRRPVPAAVLGCAGLSLLGTGLMVWGPGGLQLNPGDLAILCAALLRAVMVVATKQFFGGREVSSGALTVLQLGTVTMLAGLAVLASEGLPGLVPPSGQTFWTGIAFLALFCTLAAFFIQNWAVRRTNPTRVGFLMGTEPLFGALFAVLLLNEALSPADILGAILILLGTSLGARLSHRVAG